MKRKQQLVGSMFGEMDLPLFSGTPQVVEDSPFAPEAKAEPEATTVAMDGTAVLDLKNLAPGRYKVTYACFHSTAGCKRGERWVQVLRPATLVVTDRSNGFGREPYVVTRTAPIVDEVKAPYTTSYLDLAKAHATAEFPAMDFLRD